MSYNVTHYERYVPEPRFATYHKFKEIEAHYPMIRDMYTGDDASKLEVNDSAEYMYDEYITLVIERTA